MVCAIGASVEQASSEPAGQPGGLDVNVVNTPNVNIGNVQSVTVKNETSIPVKDSNRPKLITTSTRVRAYKDQSENTNLASIPTCPDGEHFLFSGLYAAPSTYDFPDSVSLGPWIVSVEDVWQLSQSGFFRVPLNVGSEGHWHASVALPGRKALIPA